MRFLTASAAALAVAIFQAHAAFGMDTMTTTGGAMKMAKCPAGDPAVIVNTKTMTYTMDTKANRNAMKGMMGHDRFVCKSQAEKMGAHIRRGSMNGGSMNGGSMSDGSMNGGSMKGGSMKGEGGAAPMATASP